MNPTEIIIFINLAQEMISSKNHDLSTQQRLVVGKIIQDIYCGGEYINFNNFFEVISTNKEVLEVNVPKLKIFPHGEITLLSQLRFLKQELSELPSNEIILSINDRYGAQLNEMEK